MDACDHLTDLLPPVPRAHDLPHHQAHRSCLLAAMAAEPHPARPAPRYWPAARRWLVPLAAAAAVTGIVLAAVALPRVGSAPPVRGRHPQARLGRPARFARSGSLAAGRHWQVSTAGIGTVVVRTNSGAVSVVAQMVDAGLGGGSQGTTLGSAAITAKPSHRGSAPTVATTKRGPVLTISAQCLPASGPRCRVSLYVTVPAGMSVKASSQLSDVTVAGLTGPVSATDELGDVQLDNLAGPVTASAAEGDIAGFGLTSSRASLHSDLGDIDVSFTRAPAEIDVTDTGGDVTLTVPASAAYNVTAQTQLGSTSVSVPRSAGSAHVIRASSQLGDVTITG